MGNYIPFAPFGWMGVTFFGVPVFGEKTLEGQPGGMLAGAAVIFFAYIGFDAVSTNAEEAKKSPRDLPIGIIASSSSAPFFMWVSLPFSPEWSNTAKSIPMRAYQMHLKGRTRLGGISDRCCRCGGDHFRLACHDDQRPRVFLAMARDGLLPTKFFASVHPRFQTPWKSSILVGVFVAILAGLLPIDALLHMTNIGTLFAFVIVCTAVMVMRRINPDAERPFRCPLVPLVPILGIAGCLLLMFSLPVANWWRLVAWLGLGLVIYFSYSRFHSRLGTRQLQDEIALQGVSPAGSPIDPLKSRE